MKTYYAHSTDNPDKSDWQQLEDHLQAVANRAEGFASAFNAGDWGRLAGLWHDAGKACQAFIERLEGSTRRVDHSTFGARIARENAGRLGLLLAYVIAGHHGGLPDGGSQEGELHYRLKAGSILPDAELLPSLDQSSELIPPFKLSSKTKDGGFCLSLFTRMVFSCLVDADFLDTEQFCDSQRAELRTQAGRSALKNLKDRLDYHLNELVAKAETTPVNQLRRKILDQCRGKALGAPQIFSLTVPTGGGKTLSSLTFALDHAVANEMQRVIYAIPFTSIIEQNAAVFQQVLGRENVVEHHSNFKENDASEEEGYNRRRGLAAENWDAPVVVTTNVQFFESLYSHKPSRCRKLHNIANSVIVLDEAQAIPTEYLEPCLAVLRELVEHYGCTVVLCTATQPALDDHSSLRTSLKDISEIIDDPLSLYQGLKRTEVHFVGRLSQDELAERVGAENQALCIVPTKRQARELFERLADDEGCFHLSTNMYPQHRRRVLDEIRTCLKSGHPCRVISTSLVEAGVDLDFPVVYRAMAGLDSIAQAAGRCNREGKMDQPGQVYVYEPEQPVRMPWLKRCASRASETLRSLPEADPLGLETMRRYFELQYDVEDLDKKQVYKRMNPALTKELIFPFREVAQEFRFIEDETIGVVIPIEPEAKELVRSLRYAEFPRAILRKLQPYTVSVRLKEYATLKTAGALDESCDFAPVLRNHAAYGSRIGLMADKGDVWSAETLIQ